MGDVAGAAGALQTRGGALFLSVESRAQCNAIRDRFDEGDDNGRLPPKQSERNLAVAGPPGSCAQDSVGHQRGDVL